MSATAAALVKAAIAALSDENTRKKLGWVLAAILSPAILLIAFFCSLGSGASSHNLSVVELCFYGGTIPSEIPEEYRAYIEEVRTGFVLLDGAMEGISELAEGEDGLDEVRVKALFYALYFGTDSPGQQDCQKFVSCFVTYEERTRTVTVEHEDGTITEEEETYTVAVPIEDLEAVYENLHAAMGVEIMDDQRSNADSIYSLIRYGYTGGNSPAGDGDSVHLQPGRIRLLHHDRPREWAVFPLRPLLPAAGIGGTNGEGWGCDRPVRLHRAFHGPPPPLRGARQRPADKPTGLSAIRAEERKMQ